MSDERLNNIEMRLRKMEEKLDVVLDMVSVGRGTLVVAKVLGWITVTTVAVIELWRALHKG